MNACTAAVHAHSSICYVHAISYAPELLLVMHMGDETSHT